MNQVTTTVFDAFNRPIVVTDPMGNSTTTTYDADNEVVQTVDPLGRITTATYSVRGWVPTVTDPLNQVTTYSYNSTGQTTSAAMQSSSGGGPELVAFNYNADEELTSHEDCARAVHVVCLRRPGQRHRGYRLKRKHHELLI